jgi:DNA-binding NarL/FixJ family response regulator
VLADADRVPADERVALWRTVVDATAEGVMPVRHRQIARLSLGAALVDTGARDAASVVLDMIIAEAPAQGVTTVARWASELAGRAGLGAATRRSSGTSGIEALTARERQVLELVAGGLTNSQIGERLFISPKTASVHVSAILAKVGAANRAEAAAAYAALH